MGESSWDVVLTTGLHLGFLVESGELYLYSPICLRDIDKDFA
jgi:hypothetical protein